MTHREQTTAPRWRRRTTALVTAVMTVVALTATLVPAPALAGPPPARLDRVTVAPGITREVYRYQGDRGGVDVQVLRFRPDDPRVQMKPELADGIVPGMEAPHEVTRRLAPQGAVAAVNAHFFSWSGTPIGDPIGMLVRDGEYVSQPEKGTVWRGGFGFTRDGQIVFDYPAYMGRITYLLANGDSRQFPINAVNRWPKGPTAEQPWRMEATVFTPEYGPSTRTPAGTYEFVVRGADLTPRFERTLTVSSSSTSGNTPIPRDGFVLAATHEEGQRMLAGLTPGTQATFKFDVTDGWTDLWQAVQGGPMLLRNGGRTSHASWEQEGFNPSQHSDARHPRTAVGRTADGELWLVTMDGRSSRSAGLSMHDAQTLLIHLGLKDAVMMDGGGSTQMVVDDAVVNRPSDSNGFRRVASNIVLYSPVMREPDVRRIGAGDHYRIAADVARTGWSGGARTVLLASAHTFPDALAGGPLASDRDLPILLTTPTSVPSTTMQALRDLGTTDVIILGGTAAVSERVEEQLRDAGLRPRRVFGETRVHTAARIARILKAPTGRVFLASADSWPDSASASVPASLADAPLLLTPTNELHPLTAKTMTEMGVTDVVVAGGNKAVSDGVVAELEDLGFRVERVSGPDRFATSAALATWSQQHGGTDPYTAMLARGDDFSDALIAGPLGAKERKAVLLVDRLGLERSPASNGWLTSHDLASLTVLGDRSTMSSWLGYQAQQLLER